LNGLTAKAPKSPAVQGQLVWDFWASSNSEHTTMMRAPLWIFDTSVAVEDMALTGSGADFGVDF
jgi:hypothetical protein